MNVVLYSNALLEGAEGIYDILIEDGVFSEINPHGMKEYQGIENIDLQKRLILPPYVEPHIHLDYVYTSPLNGDGNKSGTLFEAIQSWSVLKSQRPPAEIKKLALKAVGQEIEYGVQYIRTHVDITDPSLNALKVMLEIKKEIRPFVDLQVVAFPQEGMLSYQGGIELLEKSLQIGADAIGGIPHCEYTRELGILSIEKAFNLAVKYDKLIDFHCDEIDDEHSRFVETLSYEAMRHKYGKKTTASHTCAMGSYGNAYTAHLFDSFRHSGINFVCCPTENLHLQGRGDSYPKRCGVTRVDELLMAGVNVCFAQDSIEDLWYPLGSGNPMNVLDVGIHACQLTSISQIEKAFSLITTNGAKTMNIDDRYGICVGNKANFIVLDAYSPFEAICKRSAVVRSVREGREIFTKKCETRRSYKV